MTTVSEEVLLKAVGKLMAMPFFPTDGLVKNALLDELPEIVENDGQLGWLISEVTHFYSAWPGLSEIRFVYGQRYKPRDGVEVYSNVYPDGLPRRRPAALLPALPPGHTVTADPEFEGKVRAAAKAKQMPRGGRMNAK